MLPREKLQRKLLWGLSQSSVEASMEYMKASVEVHSMEASTKASTNVSTDVMIAFAKAMKASTEVMEVTFM